jgi:hypothetical protein
MSCMVLMNSIVIMLNGRLLCEEWKEETTGAVALL